MKHDNANTNMLSGYMGRSLTLLVTIFIAAIAASALLTGDGIVRRGALRVCVLSRDSSYLVPQRSGALGAALSAELGPSVRITVRTDSPEPGYDAYVMSAFDWLRLADELDLVPVCGVAAGEDRWELMLLLADAEQGSVDIAALSAGDIAFNSVESVGGFWAKASKLRAAGFRLPDRLSEFRFAGSNANGCERAVIGVLSGTFKLGTCSEQVLNNLVGRGFVKAGRLNVIARGPALPGTIVASPRERAWRLEDALNRSRPPSTLGVRFRAIWYPRIQPLSSEGRHALEEAVAMARRYRGQF